MSDLDVDGFLKQYGGLILGGVGAVAGASVAGPAGAVGGYAAGNAIGGQIWRETPATPAQGFMQNGALDTANAPEAGAVYLTVDGKTVTVRFGMGPGRAFRWANGWVPVETDATTPLFWVSVNGGYADGYVLDTYGSDRLAKLLHSAAQGDDVWRRGNAVGGPVGGAPDRMNPTVARMEGR